MVKDECIDCYQMIVFTDIDNTTHWCVDHWVHIVGYCAVDKVLIMLDGVDMRKRLSM
jgi:hypothetical protein